MSVRRQFQLEKSLRRRIDLFHNRCRELARSKRQFHNHFLINQDHIVVRGGQQGSSLRHCIEPMHIAAIINGGKINYATSKDSHPIEVAIDGVFKDFRYVEYLTTQMPAEIVIPRLQLRIVLRDGRVKILVVTVHPMQEAVDDTLPEVNYEVW